MEQPRILIVDDEQDLCQLMQTSLKKKDFNPYKQQEQLRMVGNNSRLSPTFSDSRCDAS